MMELIILIIVYVLVNFIYLIIPKMEPENRFFSVVIPKRHRNNANFKAIYKRYVIFIVSINIFFIFLVCVFRKEKYSEYIYSIALILSIAVDYIVFFVSRNKVKKLKPKYTKQNEISEDYKYAYITEETKKVKFKLFFIPVFMLLLNVVLHMFVYETNDLTILFSQIFIIIIMMIVYFSIFTSKKSVNPSDEKISKKRNNKYVFRWTLYTLVNSIVISALFMLKDYFDFSKSINFDYDIIYIIITLFLIIYTVILFVVTGIEGSRIKKEDDKDIEVTDTDDDKYWKGGLYYVNKDDPSIFVQKRYGVGHTINFGNKKALALFIGIIIMIIAYSLFN